MVPDTPEKQALLLNLLELARQNSAMHTPGMAPFTLKVSFNSIGGDSHTQGYGEVEETLAERPNLALVGPFGRLLAA